MRIHVVQHVPFEDEAHIGAWAESEGFPVTRSALYRGDPLPGMEEIDLLAVMGGPMGVYDEKEFPWLVDEKRCIAAAIEAGKKVIGICLGAQLIAAVLGARVRANAHREIGWFPVVKAAGCGDVSPADLFPDSFMAFHWHGDTFELPAGARRWAGSGACPAQAFSLGVRVMAFQFHLESTARSIENLIKHCRDDLTGGPWVQDEVTIRGTKELINKAHALMENVLDRLRRA